ncbi:hypothetical protein [Corynebacterium halotolerans]|uniref:hypothetical protein n=1 Tax=Corynebacterium halotolerans TaxID=225326 RepID=UPI003CF7807F
MRTKPITVRRRAPALARSRAVLICIIFVLVLTPILVGLLAEQADQTAETWSHAYAVAAAAPALGIVLAVLSLVIVLWRKSRPVLVVDDQVRIRHSGVSFPVAELDTVQLWSRGESYVTLLPEHVPQRVGTNPTTRKAVSAYTVGLPHDVTPRPFELAELLQNRKPEVQVDKLGSL